VLPRACTISSCPRSGRLCHVRRPRVLLPVVTSIHWQGQSLQLSQEEAYNAGLQQYDIYHDLVRMRPFSKSAYSQPEQTNGQRRHVLPLRHRCFIDTWHGVSMARDRFKLTYYGLHFSTQRALLGWRRTHEHLISYPIQLFRIEILYDTTIENVRL
jgi:hypothetical protein